MGSGMSHWRERLRLRSLSRGGMATCAVALGLAGCSGRDSSSIGTTYEVQGRVLLNSGAPLTRGRVTFIPEDPKIVPATGELGSDGRFQLTTKTANDGALPGRYKVRIEPAATNAGRNKVSRPPFPLKYIDEDSSGLVVTVRAEPNHLDSIKLK